MKSASFTFDRRLYELLQEEGRARFTTRELRDAYAARLKGTHFRIADVRADSAISARGLGCAG